MRGFEGIRRSWGAWGLLGAVAMSAFAGCHGWPGTTSGVDAGAVEPSDAGPVVTVGDGTEPDGGPAPARGDRPLLGITAFVAPVYKEPRDTSKKLGYLRVGAEVPRSAEPVGKAGCPGGWYGIAPRGFVCAGTEATINLDEPILKAARRRPDLKAAMPYRYAFVRAVLPMYMHVPTADEQYKAEFKLKEHLDWFKQNASEVSQVTLGANDVAIDERGVALADKKVGELGLGKNSQEIGIGALLGGDNDNEPIPFWLEGGKRAIPNVSEYKTKGFELFADRARRHTGLALIDSFPTGPESLNRRFAVTTDLRLVPASKIKPDTGSAFHGVELTGGLTLPLAFIRAEGAHAYRMVHGKAVPAETLEHRSAVALAGTMRSVEGIKYYRTASKHWVSQQDVGLAVQPATWPEDADKGKKWIEISITNQTLVLWEGKHPVYATLISSGRAGLDDPKKTTATVRGTFHIRNKHISAMMDSNEASAVGGKAASSGSAGHAAADPDDDDKPHRGKGAPSKAKGDKGPAADKSDKGAKPAGSAKAKAGAAAPADSAEPLRRGDGVYGVTRRRGEGTFQLRDVPYIQYFESGYALHAAYWHDVFGTPRSHGCVNLAPVDAHRIFLWTDPPVPEGWHGVNAGEDNGEGTTVIIHE